MTIEERIENAILDLRELLEQGVDVDHALKEAAKPYGIQTNVLRARAAPDGDVERLAAELQSEKADRDFQRRIDEIVRQFVASGRPWIERREQRTKNRNAAVEAALGRPLTSVEERLAEKFDTAEVQRRQAENSRKLRAAFSSIPREHDA